MKFIQKIEDKMTITFKQWFCVVLIFCFNFIIVYLSEPLIMNDFAFYDFLPFGLQYLIVLLVMSYIIVMPFWSAILMFGFIQPFIAFFDTITECLGNIKVF